MIVLESSLALAGELVELLRQVGRKDRSLADQMRRAAQSVVLNCAEAQHARGKRSVDRFSIAYGEASELKAALRLVRVFGYAEVGEQLMRRCDEVCAMLYRLSR